MDYLFEMKQEFLVSVYQCDGNGTITHAPTTSDLVGEMKFILSPVLRSPMQRMEIPLTNPQSSLKTLGSVIVRGESVYNCRDLLRVTFSAANLSNKEGFFSKSDPFLVISRLNEDSSYTPVWKNNFIKNTLTPIWAEAMIPISNLCNGDLDRPLRIEIFDYESSGKHVFMGQVATSVNMLTSLGSNPLNVIEPEKQKRPNYVNSGTLKATPCFVEHHPTFTDYIMGNCDINLMIGIDFTGSNGDPDLPNSLHYLDPTGATMNPYQFAITAVGNILKDYDRDQLYPVFGYGARIRGANGQMMPVQHAFQLHPQGTLGLAGIPAVLEEYKLAVQNLIFSGPTLFAPLINAVAGMAAATNCRQEHQAYTTLLILTDGCVDDMDATIAAIVRASSQPLSIVIVGVGNADFTAMNTLDGDRKKLKFGSEECKRDIVQFIPLRDFMTRGSQVLTQQVLNELPDQFLQFMKSKNITPSPHTV